MRPPDAATVDLVAPAVAPSADEVMRLYARASAAPPLGEPPSVASVYARLYADSLARDDVRVAAARVGATLLGFAYGHPWRWSEQQGDAWAAELSARLGGPAAARLEGAFTVGLLAVDPGARRRGLGRKLLSTVVGDARTAWLLTTDVPSPAIALYRSQGWTVVGHGPDAPDGRPGLVLLLDRTGSTLP